MPDRKLVLMVRTSYPVAHQGVPLKDPLEVFIAKFKMAMLKILKR
jgi:hypothetical protein